MPESIIDIPLPRPMLAPKDGKEMTPRADPHQPNHFLAGPENRLVTVVVRAVLEEKPNHYNPIVLYGPSGTGKSHLALGLAADWKARHRKRVECVSAVDFARELAEAVETQGLEEFRTKYRRPGLLVFEDIGNLGKRSSEKLSAQDEFVHALDVLTDGGSWVIVTAATAPSAMSGMLPTLQSRLAAGLTLPLALPERDTRLAIINRLAELRKIDLPERAARALAEGLAGTVPELVGALTQLEVPARRDGCGINVKAVRTLLADRNVQAKASIHAIALAAARHFALKLSDLRSPSRQRAVVAARDAAVYLARNMLKCSFDEIGRYFGGRDHATMMHSWHKIENLQNIDPVLQSELEEISRQVLEGRAN